MCDIYVELMCAVRFGLGWAHDVFKFARHMFMHFSCICTFNSLYSYILILFGAFLRVSLSFYALACSVAPKHKSASSQNPLRSGASASSFLTPLLLTYGFVMIKPVRTFWRTSLDKAFIRNAKSFYRIFPILTFPLSSTIGVGSHCVVSQSLVPPWSYKSFTPICTDLTILYLSSSLVFEVCTW